MNSSILEIIASGGLKLSSGSSFANAYSDYTYNKSSRESSDHNVSPNGICCYWIIRRICIRSVSRTEFLRVLISSIISIAKIWAALLIAGFCTRATRARLDCLQTIFTLIKALIPCASIQRKIIARVEHHIAIWVGREIYFLCNNFRSALAFCSCH